MRKLVVVLKIGEGSFEQGFAVTLQIAEETGQPAIEITGKLPENPTLLQAYYRWQSIYRSLDFPARPIGLPRQAPKTYTRQDCEDAAIQLRDLLNRWLQAESFRPLRERWLEKLKPTDFIRVILQTNDFHLQKLPWHLWELMERYPNAEVALSTPNFEPPEPRRSRNKAVRILAILGDSRGIDVQADCAVFKQLTHAEVQFLVEPSRQDLTDRLWQQHWDILFFAGHSGSYETGETGRLYLNPTEGLTIADLKYGLRNAVNQGLKLAIFNSCDGLGLAREFADLQIPQLIVMREPVPDEVAQAFLRYFLTAFSQGKLLYSAVREARERLQGLENQFPCASWLPVIYQNPVLLPPTWQELSDQSAIKQLQRSLLLMFLISIGITALTMGVRYLGFLQPFELQAFDHLLRLRPDEKPDPRLLLVTVTEEDVQAQAQEQRRGSLSDQSLDQLLRKLESYHPSAIGLDIYRDYPVGKNYPVLANRMRQTDRLFTICEVSSPKTKLHGVAPPPEVAVDRLGFSNFVVDPDQVIRRHLLALTPPPSSRCSADLAFSTQLALRYLYDKGIALEFRPNGDWKLGKTQFNFLEAHTGGYQGIDALGYQILLNYHSFHEMDDFIAHITLGQVLDGQINPAAVKDHIVLIGTTAESFHDYSLTPYAKDLGTPQMMAGVVLQAQMISQILSAVLDGRPLFWALPVGAEILWVWGWGFAGSLLAYRFQRLSHRALASGLAIASLYITCLIGLIHLSCWLPLVPAALALLSSGAITDASTARSARQQPSTSSSQNKL